MPDAKYYRDASGRLTFELSRIPAAQENALVTNGYDIVFQDYRRGEQVVGLEWDNWTGFTVVSKSTSSESLVEEIGAWMSQDKWAAEG
jgi:hypothetical protein